MSLLSNIQQFVHRLLKSYTKTDLSVGNHTPLFIKRWVSLADEKKIQRLTNKIDKLEKREKQIKETLIKLPQTNLTSDSKNIWSNIDEISAFDLHFNNPTIFKIPERKKIISTFILFKTRETKQKEKELQLHKELKALFIEFERYIDNLDINQAYILKRNIDKYTNISMFSQYKSRFEDDLRNLEDVNTKIAENKRRQSLQESEAKKKRCEKEINDLIVQQLTDLKNYINKNDLGAANKEILFIEKSIDKVDLPALRSKFEDLKNKYKIRRKEELYKQQQKLLVVQRHKVETERKLREEKERQEREKQERIRKEKERIENTKRAEQEKLDKLLVKKENWQEFHDILKKNKITRLYHFTDLTNIPSIKEKGGLYSWDYCDKKDIVISFPGGDMLSRRLDKKYNLHDYVRLSFCDDHPMQYHLEKRGYNLVLLEIDVTVALFKETRFSNMNATANDMLEGPEITDLRRIDFRATKKRFVQKDDIDFPYHQAEVMVKSWVPIQYIMNINKI